MPRRRSSAGSASASPPGPTGCRESTYPTSTCQQRQPPALQTQRQPRTRPWIGSNGCSRGEGIDRRWCSEAGARAESTLLGQLAARVAHPDLAVTGPHPHSTAMLRRVAAAEGRPLPHRSPDLLLSEGPLPGALLIG